MTSYHTPSSCPASPATNSPRDANSATEPERSGIQCLAPAPASSAIDASTSGSGGVLGHTCHWEVWCPGDITCYGCDTHLCGDCCQWRSLHSKRLPVPLLQGHCPHNPIMVLHTPGPNDTSVTRQLVCKVCVAKSEEELTEGCFRLALQKVASGAASQLACQKCPESLQ